MRGETMARMLSVCAGVALGLVSVLLPESACAQSGDPYINAIDDRPAARLKRLREKNRAKTVLPDMVVIPPGQFMIGSPDSEPKRDRNEGPQQPISIDYSFEIGRFEVTFAEWQQCVDAGGCKGYNPDDKGWGRGDHPVTNISYNDVESYISWLNAATGESYRLPSESEWEYVARAGRDVPFSTTSGYSISDREANFNGEFPYGGAPKGRYLKKTVPVGSYAPNDFGVHDIHGNVYEWVADCYVAGHAGNPGDGSARRDGDCNRRIMRGGSWVTHGYQMRAAKRLRYTMDYRYDDFGFRLARTLN